jgi:hypothetical protein
MISHRWRLATLSLPPNPKLKEFGKDKPIGQIQSVITIMKLCDNMDDFRKKFDRVFKKTPIQSTFDDINWTASAA